jgi:ADP-ribose pyrophosphatase YjhB (NUDIX family)
MCGGDLEGRMLRPHEPERLCVFAAASSSISIPRSPSGTIIRDERNHIVLVRRAIGAGLRTVGVSGRLRRSRREVTTAALREAREVAASSIRARYLINVYSYPGRAPVVIVYAAQWSAAA